MDDNSRFLEPLAVAVAAGQSIRDACDVVGCSESHGYSLSSSDAFKNRVSAIRTESTARAVALLSDGATKAVSTLVALLDAEKPADRIAAAKAILTHLKPLAEFGELRERFDAEKAWKPADGEPSRIFALAAKLGLPTPEQLAVSGGTGIDGSPVETSGKFADEL